MVRALSTKHMWSEKPWGLLLRRKGNQQPRGQAGVREKQKVWGSQKPGPGLGQGKRESGRTFTHHRACTMSTEPCCVFKRSFKLPDPFQRCSGEATAELEEIKHEGKAWWIYLTSLAGKTEPAVREKTASGGLGGIERYPRNPTTEVEKAGEWGSPGEDLGQGERGGDVCAGH